MKQKFTIPALSSQSRSQAQLDAGAARSSPDAVVPFPLAADHAANPAVAGVSFLTPAVIFLPIAARSSVGDGMAGSPRGGLVVSAGAAGSSPGGSAASSPLRGSLPGAAGSSSGEVGRVCWPWQVTGTYVHFVRKDDSGQERLLCTRDKETRQLDGLDGGDDVVAAVSCSLLVCKRCMRALPKDVRDVVLSLAVDAGAI